MKYFYLIFFALVFSFCRNSNETKGMDSYFEKEISNRREVLDKLASENDSLKINTAAVHEEVNTYILLSKDLENLPSAISRGNAYFLNMAHSYGIQETDFTKLTTSMRLDEIALVLKQNELNLFNQLIFKSNPSQAVPYTAQ